ncbi:MAG: flagellar filament capping protein FliD, partial [Spirochaetota bacterium]
LVFDNRYFAPYEGSAKTGPQNGSLSVDPEGRAVSLKGILWREYTMPMDAAVKKGTILSVSVDYKPSLPPEKEDETLPYKVEIGPDEVTNIKGIELHGYNVSRERPMDQKTKPAAGDDLLGVGVVSFDGAERKEKIYKIAKDAKGIQEFPLGAEFEGKKIQKIVFYCNDGDAAFSGGVITTPVDKKGLLEAKNTIAEAADAKLKVDGVDVSRSRNDGIADVIKGLTLNLKGVSDKEDIVITVDHDIDAAVKKIQAFVDAYNKYLDFTAEMTKSGKANKPGDYEKSKSETGLFIGDMTIVRLSNSLKTALSSAYPSRAETPIRMLPQIGVSTGKVNAAWDTIKEGKLQIDDETLRSAIIANPEGIKELFGSDNDGDNRIDNGFGYTVENTLEPYVRPGQNIVKTKMDQEDDS